MSQPNEAPAIPESLIKGTTYYHNNLELDDNHLEASVEVIIQNGGWVLVKIAAIASCGSNLGKNGGYYVGTEMTVPVDELAYECSLSTAIEDGERILTGEMDGRTPPYAATRYAHTRTVNADDYDGAIAAALKAGAYDDRESE